MRKVVEITSITKVVDKKKILNSVSMHINEGEICGLLGPNGAGKTTILKAILNLAKVEGNITILGETLTNKSYKYLRNIGSLIEEPTFSPHLSGIENLKLHAEYMGFYNDKRISEVLELVNLSADANTLVRKYSMGMKQRLGIAKAIMTYPKLLLLDEPINGLDPTGIKDMRDLFYHLAKKENITILISSHILSELEQLVDSVVILNHGTLVEQLSYAELSSRSTSYYELKTDDIPKTAIFLNKINIHNYRIVDDMMIRIYDERVEYSVLMKELVENNFNVLSFETKKQNLEDFYFSETKESEINA